MVVQATLEPAELPVGTGLLVFAGMFGSAMVLSSANTIFNQKLASELVQRGVLNPAAVMEAGVTGFRALVAPSEVSSVEKAYATSISHVWYLAMATAAVSIVASLCFYRVDVRSHDEATTPS